MLFFLSLSLSMCMGLSLAHSSRKQSAGDGTRDFVSKSHHHGRQGWWVSVRGTLGHGPPFTSLVMANAPFFHTDISQNEIGCRRGDLDYPPWTSKLVLPRNNDVVGRPQWRIIGDAFKMSNEHFPRSSTLMEDARGIFRASGPWKRIADWLPKRKHPR